MKYHIILFIYTLTFVCHASTITFSVRHTQIIPHSKPVYIKATKPGKEKSKNSKIYPPFDHANKVAGFKAFRDKLIEAVKRKDSKYVLSILDPKIKNSFGGDGGVKEFESTWHPEKPDSKLWKELEIVLRLGGCFDKDKKQFTAPYVFCLKLKDHDAFEAGIIVGTGVRVRSEPGVNSKIVTKLSYALVIVKDWQIVGDKGGSNIYQWIKIKTEDGKQGYVAKQYVRSQVAYRAGFVKKDGQWKMTFFLAGD